MLMPDSGPIPGSTPTSVPTTQPRKAYQRLSNCIATEKPCARLCRVVSMALEAERPFGERRAQEILERQPGPHDDGAHEDRGANDVAPLADHQEAHQHQHHGDEEAE